MTVNNRSAGPVWFRVCIATSLCFPAACGSGDGGSADAPKGDKGQAAPTAQAEDSASVKVPVSLPERIEIAIPTTRLTRLEFVEDETEAVADRLLDLSDKLRRRDFAAATDWFGEDFAGHGLSGLTIAAAKDLHADSTEIDYDIDSAPIVGRADFISSVRDLLGPWSRVDSVLWKVKGAEFNAGAERWGRVKLFMRMLGRGPAGEIYSVGGKGYMRVERRSGKWLVTRMQLSSFHRSERHAPMFVDVSAAAGLAHQGVRFGKPGNQSFAWNGAASGDVDGDGLWDLFLPSDGRNFFYRMTESGRFVEEAEERGLLQPGDGTGPVFFDFDNDGDQDLAVGQVSWIENEETVMGNSVQLYRNDGSGRFEEVSSAFGLDQPLVAYSLSVLDYDSDGWLDLFACGYGQIEREHNNSWIEATNGSPNALLRNVRGQRFEDVTESAGIGGNKWSYASAVADYDRDGHADIYVANDYGSNCLYRNRGDGTFVDVAEQSGTVDKGSGMGATWGDITGDGRLDLYVSNMSSSAGNRIVTRLKEDMDPSLYTNLRKLAAGNSIFKATENGFEALPAEAGGIGANWAWSASLADLDLDGALDIFCTNGFVTGDLPHDT